ncbi:protein kinase [Streptomyces beihaiensis]|uniref:Protein kinase n=1 Tax=Streptomyces beihaiensis TaxID=2984495 RepID=A0ABT3TTG0_9ACTN|nr:protein kinase [Streptomyces beihaiensis]MCX3060320.1 protein kinase [Streptomyces beihaiensis]
MDEYAGRVLADRYRLPLIPSDFSETPAFDTYSGQEVLVRQVPLPEVVEAEVLDADGLPEGFRPGSPAPSMRGGGEGGGGGLGEPVVARAVEAAQAAAAIPDHPRLEQVFDVFAEGGSLWIVSEAVAARPLASLLADRPLTPYRAAEVASDVLAALRVLHVYGWVHRNVTARTVLVCADGRVVLSGLAAGAAEEVLCGNDPVPRPEPAPAPEPVPGPGPKPVTGPAERPDPSPAAPAEPAPEDYRAARAGAIAAYRAGARRAVGSGVPLVRKDDLIPEIPEEPAAPTAREPEPAPAAFEERRRPAAAGERARQVRMTVVGAVTERWAPEQAWPVRDTWQLAAPVGPATDLWALGALLFRAVEGNAPYPEESAVELARLVCAEPPASAEECGPLRPVVESLLRQDPTERPRVEELRGWLTSLVRSAPEPDVGTRVVSVPSADPGRLPVVRRRGELVRRRRAKAPATTAHGRHKRGAGAGERRPRALGRWLLVLVLLGLAGAVAYAMVFMPKASPSTSGAPHSGQGSPSGPASSPAASASPSSSPSTSASGSSSTQPQSDIAAGFTLRKDPAGFHVAVADGWRREGENGQRQVVYAHGDFELLVVPGRDSAATYGSDPMAYQREHERELQPFRDSTWATSSGMKTIDVGGRTMAEGQFTWQGPDGREVFVRNVAILIGGKYHVVQVRGPEAERDEVTRLFEQAEGTYTYDG